MECNCKYFKFKSKGYNVTGHAYTCPMNPNYDILKPKQLFKYPKGNNPYKEVNRFEEEYIKINRINEKKNKRI